MGGLGPTFLTDSPCTTNYLQLRRKHQHQHQHQQANDLVGGLAGWLIGWRALIRLFWLVFGFVAFCHRLVCPFL